MIKVAINGAGRIGRAFLKLALAEAEIEVVAINDLGDLDNMIYLLKYDTAYGRSSFLPIVSEDPLRPGSSEASKKSFSIYGKEIKYFSEKDPLNLPWKDLGIDIVVESTGVFTSFEKASVHVKAGAKRVVITAPVKDDSTDSTISPKSSSPQALPGATVLMGINEDQLKTCVVSSNASCTTNAGAPLIQILNEKLGIEKAILNTVHGYTASQSIVDGPSKKGDWKEGRAAAQNIVPTSTGAAIAVTKAIPTLEGKFDGVSMRVPVIAGSIADITFISRRETTVEGVNTILKEAAKEDRWQGIFTVTEDPIVSSDIVGSLYGSIADLGLTRVIGGNLVKVCAWYDNEMGYTATLVRHVLEIGKYLDSTPSPSS